MMSAPNTSISSGFQRGAVSAGHAAEVEAAVHVFESGGNAIDAAVAAAFVAFVVEPDSCGVGGYGHLALHTRRHGSVSIDHHVEAPREAHPDLFELDPHQPVLYYGWPRAVGGRNVWGHLSTGIPGAVSGLCEAHQKFGRLKFMDIIEPAISHADAGVEVTPKIAMAIASRFEEIAQMPRASEALLPGGRPPKVESIGGPGDRLDCTDLARTLRAIAAKGPAALAFGDIAERLDDEYEKNGGLLRRSDIAQYRPRTYREEPVTYRTVTYTTGSDYLSYETLNLLSQFELTHTRGDTAQFFHLMAEALGHSFVDSFAHYDGGDPVSARGIALSSPDYGRVRASAIDPRVAEKRPIVPSDLGTLNTFIPAGSDASSWAPFDGTSQVVTLDDEGNAVALITTLGASFGSLVIVPDTGIIMNNGMSNFDPRPTAANRIEPGRRPLFNAPCLVAQRDGDAVLAIAGSGGYRIAAGVLHTFVNVVDFGRSLNDAINSPRVHCQGGTTFVDSAAPSGVADALREMGHDVVVQATVPCGMLPFGRVSAVAREVTGMAMDAAGSPHWMTGAGGL